MIVHAGRRRPIHLPPEYHKGNWKIYSSKYTPFSSFNGACTCLSVIVGNRVDPRWCYSALNNALNVLNCFKGTKLNPQSSRSQRASAALNIETNTTYNDNSYKYIPTESTNLQSLSSIVPSFELVSTPSRMVPHQSLY